jgi:hypothetical protein
VEGGALEECFGCNSRGLQSICSSDKPETFNFPICYAFDIAELVTVLSVTISISYYSDNPEKSNSDLLCF